MLRRRVEEDVEAVKAIEDDAEDLEVSDSEARVGDVEESVEEGVRR